MVLIEKGLSCKCIHVKIGNIIIPLENAKKRHVQRASEASYTNFVPYQNIKETGTENINEAKRALSFQ
jgi:hypothetical protein